VRGFRLKPRSGAAPESNRASRGLHDLTGFEDRMGHRPHAAPRRGNLARDRESRERAGGQSELFERAAVTLPMSRRADGTP